jgi:hypothetical protein
MYRLYESKQGKHPVLVHASEWDSAEAAKVFFELYQRVLKAKWKTFAIKTSSAQQVTGTGDNGRFSLLLDGRSVHSIEGIQTPERVR